MVKMRFLRPSSARSASVPLRPFGGPLIGRSRAKTAENSSGLHMQTEHWCRRTDRLTSVPRMPFARLQFRLVVVQELDFGHRIRRSIVNTPRHTSRAPGGDEPKLHADKLPAKSAELPVAASTSLDELRREWRRLYRCERQGSAAIYLCVGSATPSEASTWRSQQVDAPQAEDAGEDVPQRRPGRSRSRSQHKARRSLGPRMAWPHAHRHGDGKAASNMPARLLRRSHPP